VKGKILLTGFEPFGGDNLNPSGEVSKALNDIEVEGYKVAGKVLPVQWGGAKKLVEEFIEDLDPVIILSLGLALGRPVIFVEKVAINYASKSKDNQGNILNENYIIENGPDAYFATIPVEEVVDELNKQGIPAKISLSAGAYLCNYVFYSASHYVRKTGKKARVGFIHVPAVPEMVAGKARPVASMDVETIKNAVMAGLKLTAKFLTNCG